MTQGRWRSSAGGAILAGTRPAGAPRSAHQGATMGYEHILYEEGVAHFVEKRAPRFTDR